MSTMARLAEAGIIPVVVIEDVKDAVPTAKALIAGGVSVMEITFRTSAAPEAIAAIKEQCPEMLVGAGTIISLEQCRTAAELGAEFIVSPGFDARVAEWCVERKLPITPGCVTPSEIMAAMKLGLKVVKFFPANIYGGLAGMKALSGPFGGIGFIPTGGINAANAGEYLSAPFVHAVGGSWICSKADIAAGRFDRITALCREARRAALGFEVAHIGINCQDAAESARVCGEFERAFDFAMAEGGQSNFASSAIEVMKSPYLGGHGHIAVFTNKLAMAVAELEGRGWAVDMATAKYKAGRMAAVYLKDEIGGFAVHLLQR